MLNVKCLPASLRHTPCDDWLGPGIIFDLAGKMRQNPLIRFLRNLTNKYAYIQPKSERKVVDIMIHDIPIF